ncbi:glycosyltransferase [Niabella yanshanensis]|uniref:Glycosyltransferase n=1 Tax=Niabella yanshanensis TaxID=577386 RepID=A0ABZ0WDI6_9BACT|nr:glycosyltransferase [Niabella yanshanensis]WQD40730.1 glycosyltransferase [Niabella yanshanensis]
MIFLFVAILLLWVLYAVVILYYNTNWGAIPEYAPRNIIIPSTTFSIIIPARNEAHNIGALLDSILSQTYSRDLFEVIVVDDHSTDATAAIVDGYEGVRLIQLKEDHINSYKKKAIETGIAAAKNEWIVCTDADCMVSPDWLNVFASFIDDKNPVFVAAPVSFIAGASKGKKESVLYIFQALDFLTLQGITGASVAGKKHNMCNGANLAYKREVFYEVEGFKGIDTIASGDDMLLMHKIWKRYPEQIGYLKSKEAIVETEAAPTWKSFFNQRIRWASKATSYDDKRIFIVLLLVYLFNCSFPALLILSVFNIIYLYAFLIFIVLKTLVEVSFVEKVSRFFNRRHLLKYFFFFQPLHIGYTIISGFLGTFGSYEWKGRTVK